MRAMLSVLVLLTLFALAWFFQQRFQTDARERARAASGQILAPVPEGFGHVLLGTPSGAEPYTGPAPTAPDPTLTEPVRPDSLTMPAETSIQTRVVARGQSLSVMCKEVYGTAGEEVVAALAAFNQLASANAIREGQTIRFPPLAELWRTPR